MFIAAVHRKKRTCFECIIFVDKSGREKKDHETLGCPIREQKSTIRAWWRRFGEKGRGECEEAEAGAADIYVTCVARWTMMVVAVAHCCDIPQDVHMK